MMWTNLILFLLAIGLAIPCYQVVRSEDMDVTLTADIPRMFPGFRPETVSYIELHRRKPQDEIDKGKLEGQAQFDSLMFIRSADGWELFNHPTKNELELDAAVVEREILDHMTDIPADKESMVSQSADQAYLEARQLTPETGTLIICKDAKGQPITQLTLGSATNRTGRTGGVNAYHVLRPDRPREVILYEPATPAWLVKLDLDYWVQKTIHRFALSQVEAFYVRNELGSAGFKKNPGSESWVAVPEQTSVKDPGPVRQGEVTRLIEAFMLVECEGFDRGKSNNADTNDKTAKVVIRVRLKTGQDHAVWLKDQVPGSTNWRASSSVRKFLFLWSDIEAQKFYRVDPKGLFDPK